MKHTKAFAAGLLLCILPACEVSVNKDDADSGAKEVAQTVDSNASVQATQPDPIEQYNAEAEARARQLALQAGAEQQRAQARQQARQELQNIRFEVDISDRKLRVFQGDQVKATHDVAVGTKKWPTPTGSWEFHRVDINPEWNPPKSEEWAKDEKQQAPGSPDNPMGRARLVYRMPNTVHGTDDLNSLGKASSHGSIRVANEVVLQLAEMLLKAGGSWEGQQWFQKMTQNRTEEYQVKLDQRIPIKVQE
ncbi:MAG TPA: L,D-transpeptidase [Allosphingosinicella sp.]|nr:L,D-transpeptidase [Allosphingosinicella sp.]